MLENLRASLKHCHRVQKVCRIYRSIMVTRCICLWILRLLSIVTSLCILASASPTSLPLTKDTTNSEVSLKARSHPLRDLLGLPETQPISKRSAETGVSYNLWGNGWRSRSKTYVRTPPHPTIHSPPTKKTLIAPKSPSAPSSRSSPPPPTSPSSTPASSSSPPPSPPPSQPACRHSTTACRDRWRGSTTARSS